MKFRKAIMIDENVYNSILQYASKNGISFSGAVSVLAMQALETTQGIDAIKMMMEVYQDEKKK